MWLPDYNDLLNILTADAEKVAHLLGIQAPDLVKALIKPRIRVGNEYVQQGRNQDQVITALLQST